MAGLTDSVTQRLVVWGSTLACIVCSFLRRQSPLELIGDCATQWIFSWDEVVYNNQVLSIQRASIELDGVEYQTDSEVEDPDYETNPS
ncbi:hypothetical protein J6590_064800 [Homalodisca vitripennis]|nr:hypothetical protein J6590_064800 [Homalodisca vitripennis]